MVGTVSHRAHQLPSRFRIVRVRPVVGAVTQIQTSLHGDAVAGEKDVRFIRIKAIVHGRRENAPVIEHPRDIGNQRREVIRRCRYKLRVLDRRTGFAVGEIPVKTAARKRQLHFKQRFISIKKQAIARVSHKRMSDRNNRGNDVQRREIFGRKLG